jgi:hypothetical protein
MSMRDQFNAMAGMVGGFGQLGQGDGEEPRNMYSPFTSNLIMQAVSGTPGSGAGQQQGMDNGGPRNQVSSRRSDLLAMLKTNPQNGQSNQMLMASTVSAQMAARTQRGQPQQQQQQQLELQPQQRQQQRGRPAMQSAIPMAQKSQPQQPQQRSTQPDMMGEVVKMVETLRQETAALRLELAELRGNEDLRSALSVEIANACCVCRAVVAANTVEYSIAPEAQPTARGGPEDDDALAAALEGASSFSIAAGEELVLTYPMYRRSVDPDAPDMGQEIYMRRRTIHPQTAQIDHTYVKVVGTYSGQTVQYVSDFDLP